jgi:leucyl aminopeptidase
VVVVPVWAQEKGAALAAGGHEFDAVAKFPLKEGDVTGKAKELLMLYDGPKEKRVLLLGLGKKEECTAETLRAAYASVVKRLSATGASSANVLLPTHTALTSEELLKAVVEGVLLSNYSFEQFKKAEGTKLDKVCFCGAGEAVQLKKLETLVEAVCFTRDLVNGNADDVNVERLKKAAKALSAKGKLQVKIVEGSALEKEKMALMLAVGQAARKGPALILLEYRGDPRAQTTVALVGKGITFDTGGLNLKVAGSQMEAMKCDMAGAAAVLGTMQAISRLGLKVNVIGALAVAENAMGPLSYKPGDVFRGRSGTTVEITNTDAEGRLVLADAISYVEEYYKPDVLIDLATLTGSVVMALGDEATGLFSTDDKLAEQIIASGTRVHERMWRLPLYSEYREDLKSKIADIKNSGSRKAGAAQGAIFIKEFVKTTHWAHLDIAGTAYLAEPRTYYPTHATGVGVRLLVDFLEHFYART